MSKWIESQDAILCAKDARTCLWSAYITVLARSPNKRDAQVIFFTATAMMIKELVGKKRLKQFTSFVERTADVEIKYEGDK